MFFKKKKVSSANVDYGVVSTDIHSHLLPGIDDGSQDMETSLGLIKGMKELGFKKLTTTPHVMWDLFRNTRDVILQRLDLVRAKLNDEHIDIELNAAAEYFIDDHLGEVLQQKEPLLTFGGNLVLVEFSMASQSFELKEILFEMQMQGYQPVIAHPERYMYLERNKGFYDELKDAGCLFQLNILSLSGHYGETVLELAHYLSKKEFYNLVGTDLHHFRHLDALKNPATFSALQKLLDTGKIRNAEL